MKTLKKSKKEKSKTKKQDKTKKKREEGGELTHSVIIFESIW